MTDFLVKHFIKDYEQTDSLSVRTAYGVLASLVGILCNGFLFAAKFIIGTALHSVSVTADAFNNLSDAGSSVIGLIGVKLAEKPADQEHPFGHGRIEYIAALIVAFLVIEVGFSFFKESIGKILHPEALNFQPVSLLILVLSIGVKLWMGAFNRKLGNRIGSQVMLATAADASGDAVTTSVTILSILVFHFTRLNIDGLVGILVALLVIWAGIGIAKDTLEPLIGAAPDPELCARITRMVEDYDGILGTHDLIVHNYGPGRSMASIHAEVPRTADIVAVHETIDRIEREVGGALGLILVIHMDPLETGEGQVADVRNEIHALIFSIDPHLSIHDFRMVGGENQVNLIFDLVVPYSYDKKAQEALRREIQEKISDLDKQYQCVITIEKSFSASTERNEENL
jgi:cation diffusion facilitator family transporter